MTLDLRLAVDESAFGDGPIKVRCPVHDDPSASLAVYPDNIHCFGCGFHRNNPDEALAVLLGISRTEAHAALGQFDSDRLDAYRLRAAERARLDPLPTSKAVMFNRFLRESMPHRLEWFYQRGLTDATIDEALLGHDGARFTIPVFDQQGQLLTVRYRKDDTILPEMWDSEDNRTRIPKYSGTKGRNGLFLYGAQRIGESDCVVICEGELDALRVWQTGLCAVSATNGARQSARVPALLRGLSERVDRVILATDMDPAGHEAALQTARAATELGFTVTRLWWLEGKDITEAICEGTRFDEQEWNGQSFGRIAGPIALHSLGRQHIRPEYDNRADVCETGSLQHNGRAA